MALLTPESVFRLYETMGVPESGPHEPKKAEIIQLLNQLFGTSRGGWVVARTLAELNTVTPVSETDGGVVLTGTGAGYYDRNAGAWLFGRGFPDTLAKLTSVGGTPNAVTASVAAGVDPAITVGFIIVPIADNTGNVTLSVSGAAAKPVLDVNGQQLAPGLWPAGRQLFFTDVGAAYQLLSDPDADAAAASAANSAAAAYLDRLAAEAAAATVLGLDATSIQGRLSLTSGIALPPSDVTGATSIYYVPSSGRYAPIYDGTSFVSRSVGTQLTFALDADPGHSGYHQSGRNFDLFLINDGGVMRLVSGPSWNAGAVAGSNVARGTGAGSTELETFNGIIVNKNALTVRFGSAAGNTLAVAARLATYVGTFRATANGQATDTARKRLLFNAYNRDARTLFVQDTTANFTYSVNAFQAYNGNSDNSVEVLMGLAGLTLTLRAIATFTNSTSTARSAKVAIGLDSTTVQAAGQISGRGAAVANSSTSIAADWTGAPGLGWHQLYWLQLSAASPDTTTWLGTAGQFDVGMVGQVVL